METLVIWEVHLPIVWILRAIQRHLKIKISVVLFHMNILAMEFLGQLRHLKKRFIKTLEESMNMLLQILNFPLKI